MFKKRTRTTAIVLMILVCTSVPAADPLSSSASLTISATVASVVGLTITPTEAAGSLELYSTASNDTVNDLLVATARRVSNNSSGHTIYYSSKYGGLKHDTSDELIEYTFTYGDLGKKYKSSMPNSMPKKKKVNYYKDPTDGSGTTDEIRLTYDKGPYPSGTYTDTITFTLEEK